MNAKKEIDFEGAFQRLEKILEKMNSGEVSLDESLKLYEEADKLIVNCGSRLNAAEKKIETLIKKRTGELAVDDQGEPQREDF